jgi:hypothetical protein
MKKIFSHKNGHFLHKIQKQYLLSNLLLKILLIYFLQVMKEKSDGKKRKKFTV